MRLPARYLPHRRLVSYRPKLGEGAYGSQFGEPVVVERAAIDDKRKLIKTRDGRDLIVSSRVAVDIEHLIPEGSEVTIWRGQANERTTTVLVVALAQWPRLPQFVELSLE